MAQVIVVAVRDVVKGEKGKSFELVGEGVGGKINMHTGSSPWLTAIMFD
jgi:hypothetical protein